MKTWECKDGTIRFKLADCDTCGKKSNTTNLTTAESSFNYGRTCKECKERIKANKSIFSKVWYDIKSLFK